MTTTVRKMKQTIFLTVLCLWFVAWASPVMAQSVPDGLWGEWSLNLESREPAWMSVVEKEERALVYMRVYIGPDGPFKITKVVDGRIQFSIKPKRQAKGSQVYTERTVDVGLKEGKLDGVIVLTPTDSSEGRRIQFTGTRIPPMPKTAPDLSKVRFGHPISLFNGKDLTGWKTYETDKKNGWSARDGLLVNNDPEDRFQRRPAPMPTCGTECRLRVTSGCTSSFSSRRKSQQRDLPARDVRGPGGGSRQPECRGLQGVGSDLRNRVAASDQRRKSRRDSGRPTTSRSSTGTSPSS